jgi:hypothetical protein
MKSIKVSAIAISAAALASCGANGGGGGTAQITFYGSSINESAGGFDLYETVMNSVTSPPVPPCGPPPQASGSNSFLSGVVVCGGTNQGQIAYVVSVLGVDASSHSVTLNLIGVNFDIPAASLAAGNVTGTQGTVQAINEAIDGQTVFKIEGLNVDATAMTDAIAGGDYGEFWSLVADGGGRSLNGVYSGSGTFSVYCGANNTGAAINLTSAATPMGKFLDGC